jgi:hypothetical protein
MAVYRFPLSSGVDEPANAPGSFDLPAVISVMHAGERVCDAQLERGAYICDLPDDYAAKLSSGKLDQVFVYEPPLVGNDLSPETRRELVSILLIAARKGPDI